MPSPEGDASVAPTNLEECMGDAMGRAYESGRAEAKRRAHADIFSRSRAVSAPHAMHLAIVYE